MAYYISYRFAWAPYCRDLGGKKKTGIVTSCQARLHFELATFSIADGGQKAGAANLDGMGWDGYYEGGNLADTTQTRPTKKMGGLKPGTGYWVLLN